MIKTKEETTARGNAEGEGEDDMSMKTTMMRTTLIEDTWIEKSSFNKREYLQIVFVSTLAKDTGETPLPFALVIDKTQGNSK